MNKTAIKNFAIWARVQLIEAAKLRAYEYEITENGENKPGNSYPAGHRIGQQVAVIPQCLQLRHPTTDQAKYRTGRT